MRQFSLPPEWRIGQPCLLEGGRARYLARVLRLAPGDSFPGIDSTGRRWRCEIAEAGPERLLLAVGPLPPDWAEDSPLEDIRPGSRLGAAEPGPGAPVAGPGEGSGREEGGRPADRPPITLVQGLPRGAKMDLVVRQAAEAGVARVIPLQAQRSAAGLESEARLERWRRIVREALQQSGSAVPTRVDPPVELGSLAAALGEPGPGQLRLLLDAQAPSPPRLDGGAAGGPLAQSSLHGYLAEAPGSIVVCVGPEGGFAAEEARELAAEGFAPLALPCAVLRTETAALYAVAAVEIVLSERPSWIPRAH